MCVYRRSMVPLRDLEGEATPMAKPPNGIFGDDNFRLRRVGPINFTPSLSQRPDLILSHHPARVIDGRLPPSVKRRVRPVSGWPDPMSMTRPLRSASITLASSLRRNNRAIGNSSVPPDQYVVGVGPR
jgi:hypothetical protein